MTQIIELARQAGIFKGLGDGQGLWLANDKDLEAFAKLVAERERDACAKLCDDWAISAGYVEQIDFCAGMKSGSKECAKAIRERCEK